MSQEVQVKTGGIGFLGLLTIALLFLKAFGKISISWIWVFAPIWVPFILGVVIMAIFYIVVLIIAIKEDRKFKKKK